MKDFQPRVLEDTLNSVNTTLCFHLTSPLIGFSMSVLNTSFNGYPYVTFAVKGTVVKYHERIKS